MPSSPPAFTAAGLGRLTQVLNQAVATGGVPGITAAISRHGERHIMHAGEATIDGGEIAPDAIFRIASMTKPITATATMILVEDGRLGLDAPITTFLPELADRQVLRTIASEPDDTVPPVRPVTTRDLLTFTGGDGFLVAPPDRYPIQEAIADAGIAPGPPRPGKQPEFDPAPEAWLQRLATVPLLNQPGERWRYHTSAEILGVLIARAAGQSLGTFMQERIFAPLGMRSTGFQIPADRIDRLTTCYQPEGDGLTVYDPAQGSAWRSDPVFPNGGGDLLSTAADMAAFGEMLIGMGERDGGRVRILSPETVALMTTDHLTDQQKLITGRDRTIFGIDGWGFGMQVHTEPTAVGEHAGSYGWAGGLGTAWANDPEVGLVAVLLTNRSLASPEPPAVFDAFWRAVYATLA